MNLKEFFKKVKEFNSFSIREEFFPDYVFNKNLFRFMIVVLFFVGFYIVADSGFDFSEKFYFNCPENQGACPNPFLPDKDFVSFNTEISFCPEGFPCDQQVFPPGFSFGEEPNHLIGYYGYFAFGLVAFVVLLNHLLFNRREKK